MTNRLPSIKELHAFIVTAEQRSFTAAAKVLNVTQGAISRQIIALEDKVNGPLFHRHARGLTLTRKGTDFLPLISKGINQIQHAVDSVSCVNPVIKLKIPSCITTWLLPKIMTFQQAYPHIEVELTSSIKHDISFTAESFDAAICYLPDVQDSNVNSTLLLQEILTPVCSPTLVNKETQSLTLQEMQALPWLHSTPQQSDWGLWLSHAHQPTLTSNTNQHFATLDLAVSAAKQGFGVSIGDITLAASDIASGNLLAPHSLQVISGKGYYLVYPAQADSPSLHTLMCWLVEH